MVAGFIALLNIAVIIATLGQTRVEPFGGVTVVTVGADRGEPGAGECASGSLQATATTANRNAAIQSLAKINLRIGVSSSIRDEAFPRTIAHYSCEQASWPSAEIEHHPRATFPRPAFLSIGVLAVCSKVNISGLTPRPRAFVTIVVSRRLFKIGHFGWSFVRPTSPPAARPGLQGAKAEDIHKVCRDLPKVTPRIV